MSKGQSGLIAMVLACAVLCVSVPAGAVPIVISNTPADFSSMGVTGTATSLLSSSYSYGTMFSGDISSQVFDLDSGDYLYLYQVENDGPSIMEKLVVFSMCGGGSLAGGYLTANEPTGFLAGGVAPAGIVHDADPAVRTVGFDFPAVIGGEVSAGEHTCSLYLVSPRAPMLGEAHVIDGGVGSAEVWVDCPEPATLCLLAVGAAGLLRRRRRARA